jgi:hypothetical protein
MQILSRAQSKGDPRMGRFSVEFEVANNIDVGQAGLKQIPDSQVRRVTLTGVVDPGARLVLPGEVVNRLGVPKVGTTKTRYADGRVGRRMSSMKYA